MKDNTLLGNQPVPVRREKERGIVEQLEKTGPTSMFISLIKRAGIENKLNREGPFTVFVPSDEAFNELPESTIKELTTNSGALEEVLNYHIVNEEISGTDLESYPSLETIQGDNLLIESEGGDITVNDASVVKTDIRYLGGKIHLIDCVLMP